jgi:hypothetical protein
MKMTISAITANIFSKLGSNTSLLPIAAKDCSHSLGLTTASYITGDKIEGKDRLIDEFGTQAIWLGGIPFYKKVIDNTVYKLAKHNASLDTRVMNDPKILAKAIFHAPTPEIAKSIQKASDNIKTFKGLALVKFVAATALTLGSYAGLTTYRHNQTEKAIIKEIQKEEQTKKANQEFIKNKQNLKNLAFSSLANIPTKQKSLSFGMNMAAGLKDFMFNPVKNMMIVDGGITAERLKDSRNPQDFLGYVIKEGSFWAFMYYVGPKIQEHFENKAQTKNNKNINLDIRVLQDAEFKTSLSEKVPNSNLTKMEASLQEFAKTKTDEEVYEFVCDPKNKENLVVKMAKKSEIIDEYKKTGMVDTQKFIDLKEVTGVHSKIKTLMEQQKNSQESIEEFMKKVVSLKKGSIAKNLGTCMGVLGLVVPGVMLAMRFANKDNTEFQVKKQIKEKMLNQTV